MLDNAGHPIAGDLFPPDRAPGGGLRKTGSAASRADGQ